MRGCNRCAELEQLLERTALEHWNVIHRYRGVPKTEKDPALVEQMLRDTKTAMDDAKALYDQHLAEAHPKPNASEAKA
jgi:hypothetical protein